MVAAPPEGWPSGLRRTPGKRVGVLPLAGSNPAPSATKLEDLRLSSQIGSFTYTLTYGRALGFTARPCPLCCGYQARRQHVHRPRPAGIPPPRRPQAHRRPRWQRHRADLEAAPDGTLVKALVRAHRWRRKIERGHAKSITDLAEQEAVTVAYVCRLLPLTCLAPDVVEAILGGRQPKGLRLVEMLGNVSMRWEEQRGSWDLAHPTLGTHRLRSS
jgi:hypothetical protein